MRTCDCDLSSGRHYNDCRHSCPTTEARIRDEKYVCHYTFRGTRNRCEVAPEHPVHIYGQWHGPEEYHAFVPAEAAQRAAPHVHDWTASTAPGAVPGLPGVTCIAPGHAEGAAPRAEGLDALLADADNLIRSYVPEGSRLREKWLAEYALSRPSTPRAEGLDVDWNRMAEAWGNVMDGRRIGQGIAAPRIGFGTTTPDDWQSIAAEYARLSRSSDERRPEGEESR